MTTLTWDGVGERVYETGVDHGVLYIPDAFGVYNNGVAWNGLVSVSESPSGAEPSAIYADNIKYLTLLSVEEFAATIEAYTYPQEFAQFDGTAVIAAGVTAGQQTRRNFGLSYRTRIGNDVLATEYGYKLHLIYGALAAPTEKAYSTINDSPDAITFSWELSTNPVPVPGYKPTAVLTIDSTKVNPAKLVLLEQRLYGTVGTDPSLPTPEEVIALVGASTLATPTAPSYNATTKVITIPGITGVQYKIAGVNVPAGDRPPITANAVVTAVPKVGYHFPPVIDDDWLFVFA